MPRQARLIFPQVAVHIVQRGNNRAPCFRIPGDYQLYLLHLKELASGLDCRVHAYCLMTNHVHLLLTPPTADACVSLMRNLGQRYVQYFNRRHDRTGTLWEGRFRSCVTESARYVLACYRYIELNPVRAGMAANAAEYPWSSHGTNTGAKTDPLIVPHPEFLALGSDSASRSAAYGMLFGTDIASDLVKAIRESTNGGYPLASASLADALAECGRRRIERGKPGRPRKPEDLHFDDEPEIGL